MEKIENNLWKYESYLIRYRGENVFDVYKKKTHYTVDINNNTCTCKAWEFHKHKNDFNGKNNCKHLDMCRGLRNG